MSETREVVRCAACRLNQYPTALRACRRCERPLAPVLPTAREIARAVLQVAPIGSQRQIVERLGERVCGLREIRGVRQHELAARSGIARSYLSRVECGGYNLGLSRAEKLAEALGVSLGVLLSPASLADDPFVAEVAPYAGKLSARQKQHVVDVVRAILAGR